MEVTVGIRLWCLFLGVLYKFFISPDPHKYLKFFMFPFLLFMLGYLLTKWCSIICKVSSQAQGTF